MADVVVKWLKSPRQRYGIPRAPGTTSLIPARVARQIKNEDPDFFVSADLDELDKKKETPPEVKDTQQKEVRTRPVKKYAKKS